MDPGEAHVYFPHSQVKEAAASAQKWKEGLVKKTAAEQNGREKRKPGKDVACAAVI
jgi:hypothetical protein